MAPKSEIICTAKPLILVLRPYSPMALTIFLWGKVIIICYHSSSCFTWIPLVIIFSEGPIPSNICIRMAAAILEHGLWRHRLQYAFSFDPCAGPVHASTPGIRRVGAAAVRRLRKSRRQTSNRYERFVESPHTRVSVVKTSSENLIIYAHT